MWSKLPNIFLWRRKRNHSEEDKKAASKECTQLITKFKKRESKLIEKQKHIHDSMFNNLFEIQDPLEADRPSITKNDKRTFEPEAKVSLGADQSSTETQISKISVEDFSNFLWSKWKNGLFLSRTLTCTHSIWLEWTYKYVLKDFKCPVCSNKVNIDEISQTVQIDDLVLLINQKLDDKELYTKNLERLRELLKLKHKDLKINIQPGSKLDVLDINKMKWWKGEVIKRTNLWNSSNLIPTHFESLSLQLNNDEESPFPVSLDLEVQKPVLLYIEYKIDGSKYFGYFKSNSMLLAPSGYFTTSENSLYDEFDIDLSEYPFNNISIDDSSGRMIRVLSRLNRILTLRPMNQTST